MKKLLSCLVLAALLTSLSAAAVVIQTEDSAGVYPNAKSTAGVLQTIVNSGTVSISGNVNTTNTPIAAIG